MDIVKIGIIGLIGAVLATTLSGEKGYSILISMATGLVLFFIILPLYSDVFNVFNYLGDNIGIDSRYVMVLLKAIGIAYISTFSAQLCRDFGQNSIADKIELGGKVIILINAMTIVNELIEEMTGFIMWKK